MLTRRYLLQSDTRVVCLLTFFAYFYMELRAIRPQSAHESALVFYRGIGLEGAEA